MKITELKKVRQEKGMTQEELAQKSKLLVRTYQRYESGERVPDVRAAILLAQALQTTVEKLFNNSAA